MNHPSCRLILAAALALVLPHALAQTPAPATSPAAPAAPPAPATVSVEQAYKKEFAFLEAQKRELTGRLASVRQQFERDRARLEGDIAALDIAVNATWPVASVATTYEPTSSSASP